MVAIINIGPFGGLPPPKASSGQYIYPYGLTENAAGPGVVTVAANTAYYVPYPIFAPTSFSGSYAVVDTTGAFSNARMCLAAESATGGPGALLKDFGAQVIGTAGLYGFTSTIVVSIPQMYYLGIVFDSTPVMRSLCTESLVTAAGIAFPSLPSLSLPRFTNPGTSAATAHLTPMGYTGPFTYGAWGATVAAATADIRGPNSATTQNFPLMALKVT